MSDEQRATARALGQGGQGPDRFVVRWPGGYEGDMRNVFSLLCLAALSAGLASGCTQEFQNQFGRSVQNWTGTDGVLDIYAGDKLVKRFVKIDKLSTARGTGDGMPRSYRYGYGYHDTNLNMKVDPGEKKVYFEFSDYSTSYVFYEKP